VRDAIQTPLSGPDERRMEPFLNRAREALGEQAAQELAQGGRLTLEEALSLAGETVSNS
jgi:hypothetical protein